MRVLLLHGFPQSGAFGTAWVEAWLSRLRAAGIDVQGIAGALGVPGGRMPWRTLDAAWRRGDGELLGLYERLSKQLRGFDVLVNYGGINLHPEFLRQLPVVTVLGFFDDPESSDLFSRPVAAAHHLCMVGNVAEVATYRSWGVEHAAWWPLGFRADDYDTALTESAVLHQPRDVEVVLLCERVNPWRRRRVDLFAAAFPDGAYFGPGWPSGFLEESKRVNLLQRARIGVNIHNSTGPINFRTFYLPANGVLQLCDNRHHLAEVFEPGREVIGFETIEEAIAMCRYYLAHEEERRRIAAAGWRRAVAEYNEVAVFKRLLSEVAVLPSSSQVVAEDLPLMLQTHRASTRGRRALHQGLRPLTWVLHLARRAVGVVRRRTHLLIDTWRLRSASESRKG